MLPVAMMAAARFPGEPLRQGPHNPLRQRSVGWSGEAVHGDGAASELRRGSLPELGAGSYSSPGGAPVMHRTSWHGQQQQQQQQVISQMLALGAQPPAAAAIAAVAVPAATPAAAFRGVAAGSLRRRRRPGCCPRMRASRRRSARGNGSLQSEPMVPFGSPALRSRLAYGSSVVSQSLDQSGLAGAAFLPQAGSFDDSALNMLLQAQMGLDGGAAAGDDQARSA